MNQLYQAFKKEKTILRMIQSTCSDDWPSGQVWLVMSRLNKKFCPNDSIVSLQAETELAAIKMRKNEDPSEFHDKLYEVKQRYHNAISDLQVRNAMIRQCRKEYTEEVVKAMSAPTSTTDDLLEGKMNRFRCLTAHVEAEDSDEEDVALAATYNRPPYRSTRPGEYQRTMTCYLSGEKGHKVVDCPKCAGTHGGLRCDYCGRYGHSADRCYHHPDNLPNAPMWVRRMHGLTEETPSKDKETVEEVGAFAFMSPQDTENEVSFASFDEGNKENVEPSEMIVENLSDEANLPNEDEEQETNNEPEDIDTGLSVGAMEKDSDYSTYYDTQEDHDLDSFFDEDDVLVYPPSPMSVESIIDLTKSSTSDSDGSRVARMPTATAAASVDSCSDSDLFPSDSSDDEVAYVKTKKVDMDSKPADIVNLCEETPTPDMARTLEQNVPALELIESLQATDSDLADIEILMDPEDRDRAIISYRLDEIAVAAAYDLHGAWIQDSSDPVAIMEHVDPELVERIDLAIETNDQEDLDLLLGVPHTASGGYDADETALVMQASPLPLSELDDDDLLVLDTGCTVHTKRSMSGGFNIRPVKKRNVVAFDGRAMPIRHRFDMRGTVVNKEGKAQCRLTLGNLNHVPSSRFNLFSASQAINQGWEVHVNVDRATVRKGNQTLTFDYVVTTGTSQL